MLFDVLARFGYGLSAGAQTKVGIYTAPFMAIQDVRGGMPIDEAIARRTGDVLIMVGTGLVVPVALATLTTPVVIAGAVVVVGATGIYIWNRTFPYLVDAAGVVVDAFRRPGYTGPNPLSPNPNWEHDNIMRYWPVDVPYPR